MATLGRALPRLFGSHRPDGGSRVDEVIELVGASSYANRPIGELSGGEQQRLLIAQSIVHQPEVLLLDEPLSSLDYPNQMAVTALVGRISREQGITVLMVTHDVNPVLGQAQKVVYIAKRGRVGYPGRGHNERHPHPHLRLSGGGSPHLRRAALGGRSAGGSAGRRGLASRGCGAGML